MPNILGKYDPLRGCPKCGYNPRKEEEVATEDFGFIDPEFLDDKNLISCRCGRCGSLWYEIPWDRSGREQKALDLAEGEVEGAVGVDGLPKEAEEIDEAVRRLEKRQLEEGGPVFYPATEQLLGQTIALKAFMSVEDWTFASYWEEYDFGIFIRNKIRRYCYRGVQGTKDIDWQEVEKAAHEYVGARYRI